MKLYEYMHNALKYTLKDLKAIVLLGIILSISASVSEIDSEDLFLLIITMVITLLLLFIEEAYRYKIIENTIKGDNKPPLIEFNKEFFKEGVIETIKFYIYIAIVEIISKIMDMYQDDSTQIIMFVLGLIVFLAFIASSINKVLHEGKFKSAFNLIEIFSFYKTIGFKDTLFLIVIGFIGYGLIVECVFDKGVLNLTHLLQVIVSFFLSPILLLFMTRLMALFGKDAANA